MKEEKKQLFSAMLNVEDSDKFADIARHRKKTKSAVLREWIAKSHRAIRATQDEVR